MLAIYKKELRTYFTSMIGYVFIAFFLVIIGFYFFIQNLLNGYANFEVTLSSVTFIFVLLAPLLTMRLMAEENKQKTDQLLLTSPLSANEIIGGKYLAVFSVFMLVMLISCFYPLIMTLYGTVSLASSYASIFGFALLGGAYLAIGLFISSLTESQIVAAVISFVVFLFTIFMEGISTIVPADKQSAFGILSVLFFILCILLYQMMRNITLSIGVFIFGEAALFTIYKLKPTLFDGFITKVFTWFSVISRFDTFYYGILDLSSIVYYLSIIFIFLFLSTQVIKKKRWS